MSHQVDFIWLSPECVFLKVGIDPGSVQRWLTGVTGVQVVGAEWDVLVMLPV